MRVSLNPIWSKYAAEQMPAWLEWLRNISLKSYIELSQKFIDLNPYYAPQSDGSEAEDLFNRLTKQGYIRKGLNHIKPNI